MRQKLGSFMQQLQSAADRLSGGLCARLGSRNAWIVVLALLPACCVVLGLGKPQPLSHKLPIYKRRIIIFACFAGVNTPVLMFLQDWKSKELPKCWSFLPSKAFVFKFRMLLAPLSKNISTTCKVLQTVRYSVMFSIYVRQIRQDSLEEQRSSFVISMHCSWFSYPLALHSVLYVVHQPTPRVPDPLLNLDKCNLLNSYCLFLSTSGIYAVSPFK